MESESHTFKRTRNYIAVTSGFVRLALFTKVRTERWKRNDSSFRFSLSTRDNRTCCGSLRRFGFSSYLDLVLKSWTENDCKTLLVRKQHSDQICNIQQIVIRTGNGLFTVKVGGGVQHCWCLYRSLMVYRELIPTTPFSWQSTLGAFCSI